MPASSTLEASAQSPPPSDFPNLDTITIDIPDLATGDSETLGYLHSIGLDYGWGVMSSIQWVLEHFHVWGHLPWWAAIAATGITFRLALFPLFLRASDSQARSSAIMSLLKPVQTRMTAAQRSGDQMGMMNAWSEMSAIKKRAGVSTMAQFVPIIVQGVIGYSGFWLLRGAAALPVPGFRDGGFLHLTDLTVTDPYLLLPLAMAGALHLIVRWGGESGANNPQVMTPAIRNMMLYGLPGLIFIFMGWQSGALCVWFASTTSVSMIQALVLQRPGVRKFFGIAPIYKPSKEEAAATNPLTMLMESMRPSEPVAANKSTAPYRRPSLDVGIGAGKNSVYMSPSYQAPNLHTRAGSGGRVIDVVASKPSRPTTTSTSQTGRSDGMVSPTGEKKPGVVGSVKKWYEGTKSDMKGFVQRKEADNKIKRKRAEADAYERRARDRGR